MDQREWLDKAGLIEFYIHDSTRQLEEGIRLLKEASWYCREVNFIDDNNRSNKLNDEVFILVERIKELHNYWQNEYDASENDEW